MSGRVFIVHQWSSSPDGDWYPWLRDALSERGFEVHVPEMPNPSAPEIDSWVSTLAESVGPLDSTTYFIGHSVGCQTILRYLESLDEGATVAGALLVAPWLKLRLEALGEDEVSVAEPWLNTPIDWDRVLLHTHNFVAILAADDPYVPIENAELLKEDLNARVVVQPKGGHLEKAGGYTELHIALNEFIKMAK